VRRDAAHLKLEKPHFLFLEGWGTSIAPAGTSTNDLAADASTPTAGTNSTAASSAHVDGGGGFHLSGVARPPSLSSSSSSNDEFAGASGRESPCCSRSRYSSSYCSRRSRHLRFFSFVRAARSCSRHHAVRAAARARGVGGSDRTVCTVTLC
jgi:hypothetical protein